MTLKCRDVARSARAFVFQLWPDQNELIALRCRRNYRFKSPRTDIRWDFVLVAMTPNPERHTIIRSYRKFWPQFSIGHGQCTLYIRLVPFWTIESISLISNACLCTVTNATFVIANGQHDWLEWLIGFDEYKSFHNCIKMPFLWRWIFYFTEKNLNFQTIIEFRCGWIQMLRAVARKNMQIATRRHSTVSMEKCVVYTHSMNKWKTSIRVYSCSCSCLRLVRIPYSIESSQIYNVYYMNYWLMRMFVHALQSIHMIIWISHWAIYTKSCIMIIGI